MLHLNSHFSYLASHNSYIRLIMKYLQNILALLFLFCSICGYADDVIMYEGIPFYRYQVPTYTFADYTPHLKLKMGYADFEVSQEVIDRWVAISNRHIPYEIDLVFTLYPKDIKTWRTNFDELLRNRIYTLLAADTTLRDRRIKWNMILQTDCQTEEEAKEQFHGFVIKFRPKRVKTIDKITSPNDIKALISGFAKTRDSTVYRVMERNPRWENMLVVADWTASMYKYGVQLVVWHKYLLSTQSSRVKHFVFFNDGNKRTTGQKTIGKTGGVYRAKNLDIQELVQTMSMVMKKGNGGDIPENDIEALMTGIQYLNGYEDIILIADNKSDIRDIKLLPKVNKPVHIILCDVADGIHPHYIDLAFQTGGSIHTIEADLYSKSEVMRRYKISEN